MILTHLFPFTGKQWDRYLFYFLKTWRFSLNGCHQGALYRPKTSQATPSFYCIFRLATFFWSCVWSFKKSYRLEVFENQRKIDYHCVKKVIIFSNPPFFLNCSLTVAEKTINSKLSILFVVYYHLYWLNLEHVSIFRDCNQVDIHDEFLKMGHARWRSVTWKRAGAPPCFIAWFDSPHSCGLVYEVWKKVTG